MYCSNCGNAVTEKLKYCNSCGQRLAREKEDKNSTPGKMLDNILTTLFLIVMFGLGILVGLVAVLLDKSIPIGAVVTVVFVYLAAIFGICFMLLGHVKKLVDFKLNHFAQEQGDSNRPHQQRSPITAQLEEYREPAMSVTDNTTRALDPIETKRR